MAAHGDFISLQLDYQSAKAAAKAKIADKANSGQYFRTQFGTGFPKGYEAQNNSTHKDPVKTGSLYKFPDCYILDKAPHKPDEWFTQEVIADGNHIIIKVNGKVTVDKKIDNPEFLKGHFAIQQHDPGTVIKIRKIEYIPLPATSKN